jgi:hypothetical protein
MAKFVAIQLARGRGRLSAADTPQWAAAWASRFADGLRALEPRIRFEGDRTAVILFDDDSGWASLGDKDLYLGSPTRARALEGRAPVLVRFHHDTISARTDAVASRAVWFGHRDGVSVVSSSMRAAVSVLREFRLNPAALGWMLSAGNLGPGHSWSTNVHKLAPASEVVLSADAPPVVRRYSAEDSVAVEAAEAVRDALHEALEPLARGGRIALLLSGGVDSRVVLGALQDCGVSGTSAVTWGRRQALLDPLDDAWIARQLAAAAGIPHVFLPIEWGEGSDPELILDRFVRISEGTVDWIAGYVDRFAALQWLADTGLTRVLRGDQCFGSTPIVDALHLRRLVHGEHTADHPFLSRWRDDIPDVALAPEYDRGESESMSDWRDRLYRTVIVPYTLSPLAEAKTPFLEQYNPFLDRPLVSRARSLPERLRDGKPVLNDLARGYYPGMPMAERSSLQSEVGLLVHTGFGRWVDERVMAAAERTGLPPRFGEDLVRRASGAHRVVTGLGASRFLRRVVPTSLVRRARSVTGPLNAPKQRIALRLIIADRAMEALADDARCGVDFFEREHTVREEVS